MRLGALDSSSENWLDKIELYDIASKSWELLRKFFTGDRGMIPGLAPELQGACQVLNVQEEVLNVQEETAAQGEINRDATATGLSSQQQVR